ncbi:hypothetical protein MRBBS_2336 [Marinobacter sp. BSs20148]|nr:hypothetical protein MRBBS_2336 [Marinobacter sp. BSs20148]
MQGQTHNGQAAPDQDNFEFLHMQFPGVLFYSGNFSGFGLTD